MENIRIDFIDGKSYTVANGEKIADLNESIQKLIKQDYPEMNTNHFISHQHLAKYRLQYLQNMMDNANKKNDAIRSHVYDVTKIRGYKELNIQDVLDKKKTFGQRLADDVARFGGSWIFIISFMFFMGLWMLLNIFHPFGINFDAYPFILLNLALSTLAAIQAPLIMMSQNRASDHDRLQAKNDYLVNQHSEEGIRLLHDKLDHLVQQDQADLLEIQKIQTEMLLSITQQLSTIQSLLENDKTEEKADER